MFWLKIMTNPINKGTRPVGGGERCGTFCSQVPRLNVLPNSRNSVLGCGGVCAEPQKLRRGGAANGQLPHLPLLLQVTASLPAFPELKSRLSEPKMFFHELKKPSSVALDFMVIRPQSGLTYLELYLMKKFLRILKNCQLLQSLLLGSRLEILAFSTLNCFSFDFRPFRYLARSFLLIF